MLGCVERGSRLHILCRKVLRSVVFVNGVASEADAKRHDCDKTSQSLL
jgi:hypothetical protein